MRKHTNKNTHNSHWHGLILPARVTSLSSVKPHQWATTLYGTFTSNPELFTFLIKLTICHLIEITDQVWQFISFKPVELKVSIWKLSQALEMWMLCRSRAQLLNKFPSLTSVHAQVPGDHGRVMEQCCVNDLRGCVLSGAEQLTPPGETGGLTPSVKFRRRTDAASRRADSSLVSGEQHISPRSSHRLSTDWRARTPVRAHADAQAQRKLKRVVTMDSRLHPLSTTCHLLSPPPPHPPLIRLCAREKVGEMERRLSHWDFRLFTNIWSSRAAAGYCWRVAGGGGGGGGE